MRKTYFIFFIIFYLLISCNNYESMYKLTGASCPSYSPDGSSIIFSPEINDHYYLVLYNLISNDFKLIIPTNLNEFEDCKDAIFLNDSKFIVFSKINRKEENSEICIVSSDGGEYQQITNANHFSIDPVVTPDNKKIYFLRSKKIKGERTGYWIYKIDIDGKNEEEISKPFYAVYNMSCSNDGRYLIYSNDYDNKRLNKSSQQIIKYEILTKTEKVIINDMDYMIPTLLNNNKIVFMGAKNRFRDDPEMGKNEFYVGFFSVDQDGKNLKFLKKAGLSYYYLSKSFDDKRFLYIDSGDLLMEYNIETNEIKEIKIDKVKVVQECLKARNYNTKP